MLHRLLAGHRGLEESAARLAALIAAPVPDIAALKIVRWEFATRVMQHLALEDRHLYAVLAASPDPATAAIGRRHQQDYADHLAGYTDHARYWTNDRIVAEWRRYRAVTTEQLALLHRRIGEVERDLYPLIGVVSPIDRPASPSRSWARDAFALKASIAPG